MAKKQRAGNAWKNGYSRYKSELRRTKNKIRRLTAYVKKNPKDLQAAKALDKLKHDSTYTRKAGGGSGQTIASQRINKTEAKLRRAVAHREKFGQNESKKPSPSDMYNQMVIALLRGDEKAVERIKRFARG